MAIHNFIRAGILQGEPEKYEAGSCLFRQGEETAYFFLITKGEIALSDMGEDLLEGASAPPSFLIGITDLMNSTYSFTATTVQHTDLIRISKEGLMNALQQSPALRLYLLQQMSAEVTLTKLAFE
jgi:CRP-like cAMP-binding protein